MNLTELARRLRTNPEELRQKLPELGFSIGRRAIKIDNRIAAQITDAWSEMRRKQFLTEKLEAQKAASMKTERPIAGEAPEVKVPSVVTVRDFASRLNIPVPRLMQELMKNGILASLNERIDFDTANIIAGDMGIIAILEEAGSANTLDAEGEDRIVASLEAEKGGNITRPPVIVVMGHVDHGKTKILDAIRTTNVMETEAGGITQHIGAYQVVRNGRELTFIDTPGHEAFTVMRSRGAKVADIAILVVAADDGVQPQTKEAINIILSAKIPFVVALNKIDKADANIDRVKGQLAELTLTAEDWGGKTVMVPVSARTGEGMDALLDVLLLVTDMEKERIVANPKSRGIGTVIESHVDAGAGPVATVLVQNGTLALGNDLGVRGSLYGRVRSMLDWNGGSVKEAPPSMPVQILGWKLAPAVGDIMEVPEDPKSLKRLKATETVSHAASESVATIQHVQAASEGEEGAPSHVLNLIIRADVLGSLEAVLGMIDTIKHPDVSVKIVGKGLGFITDSDIQNAETAHAIILGFNAAPNTAAEQLARDKNVEIRQYKIIYKLFEDVLNELQKLLPSETVITELGKLEVMAIFRKSDDGWIVGGKALGGKLLPKAKLRISRAGEYVGEGEIAALQSGRSEAKEIRGGQECGLQYKGRTKIEVGDILEAYTQEKKARLLVIEGISKR